MDKTIRFFRFLSLILIIFIPAVFIFYFAFPWEILKNALPLPTFLNLQKILIPSIAIISWFFLPALIFVELPQTRHFFWQILRSIVIAMGVPFCCIFSFAVLLHGIPETIDKSAQLANHNYYLTITVDDFVTYDVYKCNNKDLECKVVFHEFGEKSITSTALTVNQNSNTIEFYRDGALVFTSEPEQ